MNKQMMNGSSQKTSIKASDTAANKPVTAALNVS